jgi:tetratricopeptide (TPR) repeat protein
MSFWSGNTFRLLISFLCASVAGASLPCSADAGSADICPDQHQYENVLRDGERFYTEHVGDRSSTPIDHMEGFPDLVNGAYSNSYFTDDLTKTERAQISGILRKTVFDSDSERALAMYVAGELLLKDRVSLALSIFSKLADSLQQLSDEGHAEQRVLASRCYAWCQILSNCKGAEFANEYPAPTELILRDLKGWSISRDYESPTESIRKELESKEGDKVICRLSSQLCDAQVPKWNAQLDAAMISINNAANFQSASTLNSLVEKDSPVKYHSPNRWVKDSDLCIAGLLAEWKGDFSAARANFIRPENENSSNVIHNAIMGYVIRHADTELARSIDPVMLKRPLTQSFQLVDFYLRNEHHDEAVSLYRRIISSVNLTSEKQAPISESLYKLIPHLTDDDEPEILQLAIWSIKNDPDDQAFAMTLKAGDTKWNGFSQRLYARYTKEPMRIEPEPLHEFAKYFSEQKDYPAALRAFQREYIAVNDSPTTWDLLDSLAHKVDLLKSDLSKQMSIPARSAIDLRQRVSALAAELAQRRRARSCLQTALKLDTMAHTLSDSGMYTKAEGLFRGSWDIKEKNLGLENAETVSTLIELAKNLAYQGKYVEAIPWFNKARGICEHDKRFQDSSYGSFLDLYAQVLAHQNDRVGADRIYDAARNFYKAQESPISPATNTR